MLKLPSDFRDGFTNLPRRCTLTEFFRDICSLRSRQTVTYPARIVLEKKKPRIFLLNSWGKLWTRLVDTDLEVLAFTFLANRSSIRTSLKLCVTSSKEIRATLSCSPPTAPFSMSASMSLYPVGLHKLIGRGGGKQDLEQPLY